MKNRLFRCNDNDNVMMVLGAGVKLNTALWLSLGAQVNPKSLAR